MFLATWVGGQCLDPLCIINTLNRRSCSWTPNLEFRSRIVKLPLVTESAVMSVTRLESESTTWEGKGKWCLSRLRIVTGQSALP